MRHVYMRRDPKHRNRHVSELGSRRVEVDSPSFAGNGVWPSRLCRFHGCGLAEQHQYPCPFGFHHHGSCSRSHGLPRTSLRGGSTAGEGVDHSGGRRRRRSRLLHVASRNQVTDLAGRRWWPGGCHHPGLAPSRRMAGSKRRSDHRWGEGDRGPVCGRDLGCWLV